MKGKHHLIVQNNRLRYELDIRRNITIIKGDSATGKTTLVDMLSQAMDLGDSSGISVSCDKEVVVVSGRRWESTLHEISDAIIFIDIKRNEATIYGDAVCKVISHPRQRSSSSRSPNSLQQSMSSLRGSSRRTLPRP